MCIFLDGVVSRMSGWVLNRWRVPLRQGPRVSTFAASAELVFFLCY